jgi:hypothetical protein
VQIHADFLNESRVSGDDNFAGFSELALATAVFPGGISLRSQMAGGCHKFVTIQTWNPVQPPGSF